MGKNIPEWRFDGFTDAWEQRKLGETLEINVGKDYKHLNKGSVPVFGTGGYMLSVDGKLSDKDSVGLGRKGTIDKPRFLKAPFWTVDTLFFMTPFENYDIHFIFALVQRTNWKRLDESTSIPSLTKSIIKKVVHYFPAAQEQKKIGTFFEQLDRTLAFHERKLKLLKRLKQSYLHAFFPKKGEKSPQIRFADFSGKWVQRKLGEIGDIRSGSVFPETEQGGKEGLPFFKVSDMNNNGNEHQLIFANNYVTKEQIEKHHWCTINRVPAILFAKVGAALMLDRKRLVQTPFLIDNNLIAYVFDSSWDVAFGKSLFETIDLPKYAQLGAVPSYKPADIEHIVVAIPSLEEQVEIGKFFTCLDRIIDLHEKKLLQTQRLKRLFLDKMYVRS